MDRKEKIQFAKQHLSDAWKCDIRAFDAGKNVFIETSDVFFHMATFGHNIVMRGDKKIMDWCFEQFESVPAHYIMDTDNFYRINDKLRSFSQKLGEENIRYLHLYPERILEKPSGFRYKWFDAHTVKVLYDHPEFDNALNFDRDVLADSQPI